GRRRGRRRLRRRRGRIRVRRGGSAAAVRRAPRVCRSRRHGGRGRHRGSSRRRCATLGVAVVVAAAAATLVLVAVTDPATVRGAVAGAIVMRAGTARRAGRRVLTAVSVSISVVGLRLTRRRTAGGRGDGHGG